MIVDQRSGETLEADEIQEIGQPNRWLSTKIINADTELIRKKFPEVGGLFNCQWGSMLQFNPAKSNKWVQIIHNNRDHYVAACKGFGSDHVLVFDSNWNGGEPDQHLIYCIAKIENTKEKILNSLMDCEKQKEYGSCGLYAIAFATALVHSLNPSELRFDVSKFRPHLINCISAGEIIPFPTIGLRVRSNWRPKKKIPIPIYCVCRMPDFGDPRSLPERYRVMTQCNMCKKYYHPECENIPQLVIYSKKIPWFSSVCTA